MRYIRYTYMNIYVARKSYIGRSFSPRMPTYLPRPSQHNVGSYREPPPSTEHFIHLRPIYIDS